MIDLRKTKVGDTVTTKRGDTLTIVRVHRSWVDFAHVVGGVVVAFHTWESHVWNTLRKYV